MRCILFGCIFIFLSSCSVTSRTAIDGERGGRQAYNSVIQRTTQEEMLLNIVRLRYCDTPFFLNISNVTNQFTWSKKGSALLSIPGFNNENPATLGGEAFWQNQPTIQYTPLEGQAFASQLMQPIDLRIIQQLIYTGWDVRRVMHLLVQSFDDIPNIFYTSSLIPERAPSYKKFGEVAELLQYFQSLGKLQIGVLYRPTSNALEGKEVANILQLSFPTDDPKSAELCKLLTGIEKRNKRYVIDMQLGFDEQAEIGIWPRSLLGCMYYLSLGVQVPAYDESIVPTTSDDNGDSFDWSQVLGNLITIHSSRFRPKNPCLAVQYRSTWFYIADCDVTSKKTFVLLSQIYNLQAAESQSPPPLLSIPLGGGK